MDAVVPHNVPVLSEVEAKAAYQCVLSGKVSMGEKVAELEEVWVQLVGAEDAAMVASGSAALRYVYGETERSRLVHVPAYACTALLNASIVSKSGGLFLVDCEEAALCVPAYGGREPYVFVHLFGGHQVTDWIRPPRIEDMCHGMVPQSGWAAITSFFPTKYIGGVGGGMVSGPRQLCDEVRRWRSYRDTPPGYHIQEEPTDLQAAVVLEVLKRKEELDEKRRVAKARYEELLDGLFDNPHKNTAIPYRFVVRLPKGGAPFVSQAMKDLGVMAEQPVWDYRPYVDWPENLPETDRAFDEILSLPFFPSITEPEQLRVVRTLKEVLGG